MKWLRIILFVLILSACSKEATMPLLAEPVPNQTIDLANKGLSLNIEEEVYNESPSMIKTTIRNHSGQNYHYGDFYSIEMKKQGEWYIVKYSDAVFYKNPQFKDYGQVLASGSETNQVFLIDELNLTLLPGDYRLVKTFLSFKPTSHEISIAVPFQVN